MRWLRRNLLATISGALVVCALIVAVHLLHPLWSLSADDKNAVPALAAAITVTGVLTTAAVSLTGIALKQSIDERTAKVAERSADLAAANQRRLTMETALQTVGLIGGEDAPGQTVRTSAALIVLGRLNEAKLAIDLAAELWPQQRITSSSAVQLAEIGLLSESFETQHAAAMLLRNNVAQLYVTANQYEWPASLTSWSTNWSVEIRMVLAATLREWLRVRPRSSDDWRVALVRQALSTENDVTTHGILAALI